MCDWENDGERAIADLNNRYPYLKEMLGFAFKGLISTAVLESHMERGLTGLMPRCCQPIRFSRLRAFRIPNNTDPDYVLGILAYLNSRFTAYYLNLTAGLHKNDVYLRRLPFPFSDENVYEMGSRVKELIPLVQEALLVEEVHPLHNLKFFAPGSDTTIRELAASFKSLDRMCEVRLFELLGSIEKAVNNGCSLDDQVLREVERDQGFDLHTV